LLPEFPAWLQDQEKGQALAGTRLGTAGATIQLEQDPGSDLAAYPVIAEGWWKNPGLESVELL
jgi:hypothetical protein